MLGWLFGAWQKGFLGYISFRWNKEVFMSSIEEQLIKIEKIIRIVLMTIHNLLSIDLSGIDLPLPLIGPHEEDYAAPRDHQVA